MVASSAINERKECQVATATAVSVPERIAGAVRFLDMYNWKVPPNWRTLIDPETLDAANVECCPLGQLFGGYSEGRRFLGLESTKSTMRLGFDYFTDKEDPEDLATVWRGYLKACAEASS